MSVELQYTKMHNKQDQFDLSPVALAQLRILASTVNDAQIKIRAASSAQMKLAQEKQDLLYKLNGSHEMLKSLEARRYPPEHEIAQQLAEIDEVERKLTNVEVKLVPIREIKAGLAVWLSPSARVLGSLMETLGTSPSVLFPDLPTDNSPLPGAH